MELKANESWLARWRFVSFVGIRRLVSASEPSPTGGGPMNQWARLAGSRAALEFRFLLLGRTFTRAPTMYLAAEASRWAGSDDRGAAGRRADEQTKS